MFWSKTRDVVSVKIADFISAVLFDFPHLQVSSDPASSQAISLYLKLLLPPSDLTRSSTMTFYVSMIGSLLFINSINFHWNQIPMMSFCVVSAFLFNTRKNKQQWQIRQKDKGTKGLHQQNDLLIILTGHYDRNHQLQPNIQYTLLIIECYLLASRMDIQPKAPFCSLLMRVAL